MPLARRLVIDAAIVHISALNCVQTSSYARARARTFARAKGIGMPRKKIAELGDRGRRRTERGKSRKIEPVPWEGVPGGEVSTEGKKERKKGTEVEPK